MIKDNFLKLNLKYTIAGFLCKALKSNRCSPADIQRKIHVVLFWMIALHKP